MVDTVKETEKKSNGTNYNISSNEKGLAQKIDEVSHKVGSNLGETMNRATAQADEYAKITRKYVEENPVQSIIIAVTVGIVAGSLLTLALRGRH